MELSAEDNLRLNVLLANAIAVRIDENNLCVHGLSEAGEAKVRLNPNCRGDRYLRYVRELLSSTVLGSPGGYPVYLKRWTRMGQLNNSRLDDLLMLGEPEAVVAVARSEGLTNELARRAWWVMPDAENARRMLRRQEVVDGSMGRVLAEFLIEFLPFEEDPHTIIETVRLLLQPGLISDEERRQIWQRGQQKSVFSVGFLWATPDALPDIGAAHVEHARLAAELAPMAEAGNASARQLLRVMSAPGQAFIRACIDALRKPSNPDVVVSLLDAIGDYFHGMAGDPVADISAGDISHGDITFDEIVSRMQAYCQPGAASLREDVAQVLDLLPADAASMAAMLSLAHVGEPLVRQHFATSRSVGSLMRRKLEPISRPILTQLARLAGPA